MSNARTIPWETIEDWYKENEQVIRDVMKFEGLRGAVNEILRLAPEQPEIAALREDLAAKHEVALTAIRNGEEIKQRLSDAERRNSELLLAIHGARSELSKLDYPLAYAYLDSAIALKPQATSYDI